MPFQLLSVFQFYLHLLPCLHWGIPRSVLAFFSIFLPPCFFELSPVTLNVIFIWTILKFISLAPNLISKLQIPKFHSFFILSPLSVNDSSAPNLVEIVDSSLFLSSFLTPLAMMPCVYLQSLSVILPIPLLDVLQTILWIRC